MSVNKKRQLKKLAKKEQRLIHKKPMSAPLQAKVKEKIPPKALLTLESAFEKSFVLVFRKGNHWIEKVSKLEDKQLIGKVLEEEFQKQESKASLKAMDQRVRSSKLHHVSFTWLKSSVLGLLGIGIPDIPVYLASVLSGIYSVGASYGINIQQEQEKAYILIMLCALLQEDENKPYWKETLDQFSYANSYDMTMLMKEASHALAYQELQAKFLQGIPLVGVAGSMMSSALQAKILAFAQVSYRKRCLVKKDT